MRINIILAEDHKLFRQGLIKLLEEFDIFTIEEAENGLQLLDQLKRRNPDVILLDIEMPEMNGYRAFEKIKELYPNQKVIFLSTHYDKMLIEHLYANGADGYHSKKDEIENLVETIRLVHTNKFSIPIKCDGEKTKSSFSKRESEIISLICAGKSNKEIASDLKITSKTVEAHKKNLFKKTNTQGVVKFVSYVLKNGLNFMK